MLEVMTTLRWHIRMNGPPAVPPKDTVPITAFLARPACKRTWGGVEPEMTGVHNGISRWKERPPCLLQRFGTTIDLVAEGDSGIPIHLEMVGGREGATGRIWGWKTRSHGEYWSLYTAEGPTLRLRSAQVRVASGWASVLRSENGTVLLEHPLPGSSPMKIKGVAARMVYASVRSGGQKWLDLGRVPAPARPRIAGILKPANGLDEAAWAGWTCRLDDWGEPTFLADGSWHEKDSQDLVSDRHWRVDSGDLVVMESVEEETMSIVLRDIRLLEDGVNRVIRHAEGLTLCTKTDEWMPSPDGKAVILVQDASGGEQAVNAVAEVVAATLAVVEKSSDQKPRIWVDSGEKMTLDTVTVFYRDAEDAAIVSELVESLRMAMPWSVVVTKPMVNLRFRMRIGVGA